jgi:hypothetical protein
VSHDSGQLVLGLASFDLNGTTPWVNDEAAQVISACPEWNRAPGKSGPSSICSISRHPFDCIRNGGFCPFHTISRVAPLHGSIAFEILGCIVEN